MCDKEANVNCVGGAGDGGSGGGNCINADGTKITGDVAIPGACDKFQVSYRKFYRKIEFNCKIFSVL